jgi:dTDP-4-amino-4,6-dideoxygalactose transaminase
MTARSDFLPFALPEIGENEFDEVRSVLESGWLTTGPKTHQFEREFAEYVGARFAVAVNSCTAAMHLALEAVGVRRGDFVLTTPYTFAATAEVIRYFDAVPVFVDVEPETLNIDPDRLRETIGDLRAALDGAEPQTLAVRRALGNRDAQRPRGSIRAVIPVHMAGHPVEIDGLAAVARDEGIAVIEDAAHACGASYGRRRIGARFGDLASTIACFSFYATKTLATGEGGMVTTDDEAWADRMRLMSLHGISKDAWKRYTAEGSWFYEIMAPGFKYNLPDLLAAVGVAQLRRVNAMRRRREEIARQYDEAFSAFGELQIPVERDGIVHAWHLYMLRLNGEGLAVGRDEFASLLKQRNIGISVHFIPLHVHPYYRDTWGYEPDDLPIAHREYRREISLPIYSRMSDADVQSVIDAVTGIVVERSRTAAHASTGR